MVSAILSRVVILVFGTLYPAYASYKAVKTKNVKEYVKWMMYWIVFALFCAVETFADVFLSWIPFYYEIKIIFVFWLLSPVTKGASFIYRKFVHPQLNKREKEIDEAIAQARTKGYSTLVTLGSRGLTYATNVVVSTAIKGQSTLAEQIKKSYSTNDLRVRDTRRGPDVTDGMRYVDDSDEEFENRLRADNQELSNREKKDIHEKEAHLKRRPLSRSKSDAAAHRPKKQRPLSGLSRLEEVEHENSMAQEARQSDDDNIETFSEEIIYYQPRKSGYTQKEVMSDPYATLPRTRARNRPRLHQP
ncbi:receptor expression-enhancing protein 1-like isoform X2 [Mya arenaria]|uniref:receptor expression-enhancing protein 1-like isoform X2 n=1 Tax=Mya arenaria TaxID=6604 RepID=UPI0022E940B6|nr:receptor expression-enhancing protein 1-like isoform X2 [Mya arenaria]